MPTILFVLDPFDNTSYIFYNLIFMLVLDPELGEMYHLSF
jgi:hypothetical protein